MIAPAASNYHFLQSDQKLLKKLSSLFIQFKSLIHSVAYRLILYLVISSSVYTYVTEIISFRGLVPDSI